MFERLFSKKPKEPMRDVAALSAPLAVPALHIALVEGPTRSHFGGLPALPAGTPWPEFNGVRLDFLARISLGELHRAYAVPWLPAQGALLFFYDIEGQPWGYDPKDRGRWAVLLVEDLNAAAFATDTDANGSAVSVPFRYVAMTAINSLPSLERNDISTLELSDAESEEFLRLVDMPFDGTPKHQVGGFPSPVQGDSMELEAQLVSNGLYCGDATGYEDPRAEALQPGVNDWRLLLQFDSDDDLSLMWGDCGMLYFWVQEAEARQGRFQNTWLVLQCA